MAVSCEYPNCREVATTILLVEFGLVGRRSVRVPVCDVHAGQAREIARLYAGIAYRLRPI